MFPRIFVFLLLLSLTGTLPTFVQAKQNKFDLPTIIPPEIEEDQSIKLPGPIDDIAVGGDGRFLLLHVPSFQKIGLFDVNQAKVVHYFPANGDDIYFSAGAQKLVIIDGTAGVVRRWDLMSQEREFTQTLDVKGKINVMIGSASAGPIYIGSGERFANNGPKVLDMQTLNEMEFNLEKKGGASRGFGGL